MSGVGDRTLASAVQTIAVAPPNGIAGASFEVWRSDVRAAVLGAVTGFVADRCAADLRAAGVDIAPAVLADFLSDGKCLRSDASLPRLAERRRRPTTRPCAPPPVWSCCTPSR